MNFNLTVLRQDFLSVEPHLQRMVGALDRSDTHPQLIAQLKQVLTELRLQSVPNSSVDTSKTHALISAHRAWEDAVTFKYPPTSSYTHQVYKTSLPLLTIIDNVSFTVVRTYHGC